MKNYNVKHFSWLHGKLSVLESVFDELEEALEYLETFEYGHAKIWNHHGELVHDKDCEGFTHHHHHPEHHHHYA